LFNSQLLQGRSVLTLALWMAGAIASFTLMGVSGRELSAELDTFGILFVRSVVGLVVVFGLLTHNGWHFARTTRLRDHLFRNITHLGGQFGWFFGIALLPLSQVFALEFTAPLWGIALAVLWLGERLSGARVIALVLGLVGVLVILRPGLLPLSIGVVAVLASAFCYAVTQVSTKRMIGTEAPLTILFFMTVIQLPVCFAAAWSSLVMPSVALWPWVILVGVTALSAHYCLARAFAIGDASLVLPIDFLRLPVIALVAAIMYGENIDPWLFLGAALMVAGNMISLMSDRAGAKARAN
jgi:drug/metabolite transporter (DMT)-like permease